METACICVTKFICAVLPILSLHLQFLIIKKDQEQNSLIHIDDSAKKIIVVKERIKR